MISILIKKLRLTGEEFVTSETIREHCAPLRTDHKSAIKYLLREGHLLRIFRGVFYVRTFDEIKLGKSKYDHLELVAKGMGLKGVKNWYFGLYTALKLNNLTHEHYTVDYVISDKIFRAKPMEIAGYKFRFLKLKPGLFGFGTVSDAVRYSDPEKTVLDFIHVWRYNGIPDDKIIMDISEYARGLSKKRLLDYSDNYSKAVRNIAERVVR